MDLFRHEVSLLGTDRNFGRATIILPPQRIYTVSASLAFAGMLLLLCLFGTYSHRVRITGRLVPTAGLSSVVSKSGGTVEQVLVSEGTLVRSGTPIAVVTNERASRALGASEAIATGQLREDQTRLHGDIASQKIVAREQSLSLQHQLDESLRQDEHLARSISIQRQQIQLQEQMLSRIQPLLSKGYVSALQVQQQQGALYSERLALEDLARQHEDLAARITTTQAALKNAPEQLRANVSELESKLSVATQELAKAETERSEQLIAPIDGRITNVVIHPGQTLRAGQTAFTVVPDHSKLVAEFLVNGSAIGLTRPGNPVSLHVDAFPYEKYGSLQGHVLDLPISALAPDDVMQLLGQPQVDQVPTYRLEVALPRQSVSAEGSSHPLLPGMTLDADLLLEKRRLIDWIFEPILASRKN
ncbi:HlyD family secretion protein [Xanthomonas sp. NCPPB 2632]|uniref:HlyD family secretion protein n=1 Tax=Xanthomonas sp. NCPPB 2632 TaxID=3240912 RepID=UPI0035169F53